MAMKVSAGETSREDVKKMFGCSSADDTLIPKMTPSSAGDKREMFTAFIRESLKAPIKDLDNEEAIRRGIIPLSMIKEGEVISAEGAKVTLSSNGSRGMRMDFHGVSSKLEGRQSPCSELIFMYGDDRPNVEGKYYPAPDIWIINGKTFSQSATKFDQIEEACASKAIADISFIMSDYLVDDSRSLSSSEGKIRKTKSLKMKFIESAALTSDGDSFVFGGHDNIIRTLDQEYKRFKKLPYYGANFLAFIDDDKKLVATRFRGEIAVIDLVSGKSIKEIIATPAIRAADLSPDSRTLAVIGAKGFLTIDIEAEMPDAIKTINKTKDLDLGRRLNSVAYSPDGKTIAIGGVSDDVALYDVEDERIRKRITIDRIHEICSFLFLDDETLIVGGKYAVARVDLKSSEVTLFPLTGNNGHLGVTALSVSPKRRYLALSGSTNLIYDLKEKKVVDRLGGDGRHIEQVLFLSDKKFVTISDDSQEAVNFWEFE